MATSKTFRPDDVGARQRLLHWTNAAASLLVFVVTGTPGLMAYFVGLLLLHVRNDRARGYSAMDHLLQRRERALALEWNAFLCTAHRREISLGGRRPHRFLTTACLVALFVLTAIIGERVGDASAGLATALRLGFALPVSAAMWVAFFGTGRRTPVVCGVDGVRVGESFVAYSTVKSFTRKPNGVVIERSAPLPLVFVPTSDPETAERLVSHLASERDRALRWRAEPSPPLPAAGFREASSQVGWRVRLLDAGSAEERNEVIARVSTEELREVLDETANPALEDAIHARLRSCP